jgi:hypothetical protein
MVGKPGLLFINVDHFGVIVTLLDALTARQCFKMLANDSATAMFFSIPLD